MKIMDFNLWQQIIDMHGVANYPISHSHLTLPLPPQFPFRLDMKVIPPHFPCEALPLNLQRQLEFCHDNTLNLQHNAIFGSCCSCNHDAVHKMHQHQKKIFNLLPDLSTTNSISTLSISINSSWTTLQNLVIHFENKSMALVQGLPPPHIAQPSSLHFMKIMNSFHTGPPMFYYTNVLLMMCN